MRSEVHARAAHFGSKLAREWKYPASVSQRPKQWDKLRREWLRSNGL